MKLGALVVALMVAPAHTLTTGPTTNLDDFKELLGKKWNALELELTGGCKKPGACGIAYQGMGHAATVQHPRPAASTLKRTSTVQHARPAASTLKHTSTVQHPCPAASTLKHRLLMRAQLLRAGCCFGAQHSGDACTCKLIDGSGEVGTDCSGTDKAGACGVAYTACCIGYKVNPGAEQDGRTPIQYHSCIGVCSTLEATRPRLTYPTPTHRQREKPALATSNLRDDER